MRTAPLLLLLCVAGAGLLWPLPADAGGRNLDGRMAPDLRFAAGGFNGINRTTKLSAYRGRPVFLKFWLRDCPICRRTLPRLQDLYARWGKRGLVVLSVVHEYPAAAVRPLMKQLGYDFPVATDVDGSQARRYGVGRRPVDYLIGVDGRVRESNEVTEQAISEELGKYRLAQVDPLPADLKDARNAVWGGRLGTALRLSEAVLASSGESAGQRTKGADLRRAVARVKSLAVQYLEGGADWARRLGRDQVEAARTEFRSLRTAYERTSLAGRARDLALAFGKRHPVPKR